MNTRWAGQAVICFEETDSTNLRAKEEADKGAPEGALVVADMQTAGRGRRGRSWNSPKGVNLYFTLILKPQYETDKASMVTLVMAMAVAEGIRETCGVKCGIKWPNDIVINGKKVCGILTEMNLAGTAIRHVLIGVGINVATQDFPWELASTAVSLQEVCGEEISKSILLENIMKAFEKYYKKFCESMDLSLFKEEYNQLMVNRDREVRVLEPGGEYSGIARGMNEMGELLVELPEGRIEKVYAGEVSVRGIYGYV